MEIIIILILIILNGIFSMSEIAMVSARKNRLETAAKKGSKGAKTALELSNSPNKLLSTVQIGITLIGILTGIFSGQKMTDDVQSLVNTIEPIRQYSESVSVVLVLFIITFFSLVLGELVPKRIGLTYPETIAKLMSRPMKILSMSTAPFIWLLTSTTDIILKVFRIQPSADSKVTEEEIKAIVQEGADGGEIQEIEQDILERVFHLGDRKISSLMTHRKSVCFLKTGQSAAQIKESMLRELHSFYPVIDQHPDEIVGVADLKSIFAHIDNQDFDLKKLLKAPQYVFENMPAYDVLKKFKSSRVHYAMVIDEYGITQGIVSINDILEALVGDVSEFYQEEFKLEQRSDGTWLVDGHYPFAEFLQTFEMEELITEYHFNTMSGLIIHLLNRLPETTEKVEWQNFEFEVIDMDGAKIDKILVKSIQ